jgi:hypothetical protein
LKDFSVTSATPLPSTWAVSVMTLVDRAGWQAAQVMAVIIVDATWLSWRPTLVFVVTLRPWMSTGGDWRPEVRLPWQKVQFVSQVAKPAVVWHAVQDTPEVVEKFEWQ